MHHFAVGLLISEPMCLAVVLFVCFEPLRVCCSTRHACSELKRHSMPPHKVLVRRVYWEGKIFAWLNMARVTKLGPNVSQHVQAAATGLKILHLSANTWHPVGRDSNLIQQSILFRASAVRGTRGLFATSSRFSQAQAHSHDACDTELLHAIQTGNLR